MTKRHSDNEDEDGESEEKRGKEDEDSFDYGEEEAPVQKKKLKKNGKITGNMDEFVSDKDLDSEQFDEHMEEIEEQDDVRAKLKMPEDLFGMGQDEEEIDFGDAGDDDEEEGEAEFEEGPDDAEDLGKKQEEDEDVENQVFAMARENEEMKVEYANQEMVDKIEKIEGEMMSSKKW